jgi:hypothetical protein
LNNKQVKERMYFYPAAFVLNSYSEFLCPEENKSKKIKVKFFDFREAERFSGVVFSI